MTRYDLDLIKDFFKFFGCILSGVIVLGCLIAGAMAGFSELDYRIYGQAKANSFNATCKTKYTAEQYRFLSAELAQQVCDKANIRIKAVE